LFRTLHEQFEFYWTLLLYLLIIRVIYFKVPPQKASGTYNGFSDELTLLDARTKKQAPQLAAKDIQMFYI